MFFINTAKVTAFLFDFLSEKRKFYLFWVGVVVVGGVENVEKYNLSSIFKALSAIFIHFFSSFFRLNSFCKKFHGKTISIKHLFNGKFLTFQPFYVEKGDLISFYFLYYFFNITVGFYHSLNIGIYSLTGSHYRTVIS